MRTALPAYPIVVEGIALQVGAYAQVRAWELRGKQPLRHIYYPVLRAASNADIALTQASPLLELLHPQLQQALALLRDAEGCLALTREERFQLKQCVARLRSEMGSNNHKLSVMLSKGHPQNEKMLLQAFDALFAAEALPLINTLKGKGLTTEMVEAFMNSTPYHEDEVLIRSDNSWRTD